MNIVIRDWYKSVDGLEKARIESIIKDQVTFKFVEFSPESETYQIGEDCLEIHEFAIMFPKHMTYKSQG